METSDENNEHIKEVYARFGLAVYCGQVLEHDLVNAMVFLDFIPTHGYKVSTRHEWETKVDSFMDHHLGTTMGRMLKNLAAVTTVPPDIEKLLREALQKRNHLAHDFFRERALDLMTQAGRERMLIEVDACRELFEKAAEALEAIVQPLRVRFGMTDESIEAKYQAILAKGRWADK